MIQASAQWVFDRLGAYKTVSLVTAYVSPDVLEILLRGKQGDLFSMLIGRAEVETLLHDLCHRRAEMDEVQERKKGGAAHGS